MPETAVTPSTRRALSQARRTRRRTALVTGVVVAATLAFGGGAATAWALGGHDEAAAAMAAPEASAAAAAAEVPLPALAGLVAGSGSAGSGLTESGLAGGEETPVAVERGVYAAEEAALVGTWVNVDDPENAFVLADDGRIGWARGTEIEWYEYKWAVSRREGRLGFGTNSCPCNCAWGAFDLSGDYLVVNWEFASPGGSAPLIERAVYRRGA